MASGKMLIWLFFLILSTANCVGSLGVNWGTQTSQNLHPSQVVQMLKDNNINKIKLFQYDHWTVKYFANTGIEVMLGVPNNELSSFKHYDEAKKWVKKYVQVHLYDGGVDIKYVAVGNEPFLKANNDSFLGITFPALQNIQKALNEAGIGDKIKATIPHNSDVYDSSNQAPSSGNFRADIRNTMTNIVKFLKDNKAPFVVNIYPFISLDKNPDFPVDFAFFDGNTNKTVQDKDITYKNVFDANFDTLIWSLRKAGCPDMDIIVGEIGWPTDANINGNVSMASKFYKGLFKKLASKEGTPLRRGPIEVYLFSLLDENQKSVMPGNFERHWGIFGYDGQPKFALDISGSGHEKMPIGAKGVQYLEAKWCIFIGEVSNMKKIEPRVNYACENSDCSSLSYGGSCSKLDKKGSFSYAFNMYYQMQNQDDKACDFEGLAMVAHKNASTSQCLFPIALQSSGRRLNIGIIGSVLSGLLMLITIL